MQLKEVQLRLSRASVNWYTAIDASGVPGMDSTVFVTKGVYQIGFADGESAGVPVRYSALLRSIAPLKKPINLVN